MARSGRGKNRSCWKWSKNVAPHFVAQRLLSSTPPFLNNLKHFPVKKMPVLRRRHKALHLHFSQLLVILAAPSLRCCSTHHKLLSAHITQREQGAGFFVPLLFSKVIITCNTRPSRLARTTFHSFPWFFTHSGTPPFYLLLCSVVALLSSSPLTQETLAQNSQLKPDVVVVVVRMWNARAPSRP